MGDFLEWAMCRGEARAERRPHRRRRVVYPGFVVHDRGRGLMSCTIRDLSATGARIAFGRGPLFPNDVHLIDISGCRAHEAQVVWLKGYQAGLAFVRSTGIESMVEPSLAFLKKLWDERIAG